MAEVVEVVPKDVKIAATQQQLLDAIHLVREEKNARKNAFESELNELCIKYRVIVQELKIVVHDADAVIERSPSPNQ